MSVLGAIESSHLVVKDTSVLHAHCRLSHGKVRGQLEGDSLSFNIIRHSYICGQEGCGQEGCGQEGCG